VTKTKAPASELVSVQNYVRVAAPEPEVLRAIGEESVQKATHKLSSKRVDQIIKAARKKKTRR
jgi:DNA topoisomerase VI subunit B